MAQPHGISRSRFRPRAEELVGVDTQWLDPRTDQQRDASRRLRLAGRPRDLPPADQIEARDPLSDPGVLRENFRALLRSYDTLVDAIENTHNRLTKRINEMVLSGTLAERPVAGVADRLYFVVVDHTPGPLYFDDGTQWVLVGSPTAESHRAVLVDGETTHTFTMQQDGSVYTPSFSMTWWTMVKISAQTPTALTVNFSNPSTAGDVLTVVIP